MWEVMYLVEQAKTIDSLLKSVSLCGQSDLLLILQLAVKGYAR